MRQTVVIPRELIASQLEVGQERLFPSEPVATGNTVTVSWSPVAGAIGYGVLVNRTGGARFEALATPRSTVNASKELATKVTNKPPPRR